MPEKLNIAFKDVLLLKQGILFVFLKNRKTLSPYYLKTKLARTL